MLESLRENLKSFGLVIAIFISVLFVLGGAGSFFVGGSSSQQVVSINGQAISELNLQRAIVMQKQQLQAQYGPTVLQQLSDDMLRNQAMSQLVRAAVLTQAAEQRGMGVAKLSVEQLIRDTPAFAKEGKFSNEQFQFVLRRFGQSPKSFTQDLKSELLVAQLGQGLADSGFSSVVELAQTAAVTEQQRDFYALILPVAALLDSVEIDEEALLQRYELTVQEYAVPEQVAVEYIELTTEALMASQDVSPELLQARFDAELAALAVDATRPNFDDEQARIESDLRNEMAIEEYLVLYDQLKDRSFNAETLQEPAEALGLELQVSLPFTKLGGEGLAEDPRIIAAAFSDDVLINGYASEVIELSDERAVVLKLRERIPERIKEFAEVRADLQAILVREDAAAQAIAQGQLLRQRINDGEALQDVAKLEGLEWQVSPNTRLSGGSVDEDIRRTAFSMPAPIAAPVVDGFSRANGDYVLVSLEAVKFGSVDSLSPVQSRQIQQRLSEQSAQKSVQAYQMWLMQQADIDVGS